MADATFTFPSGFLWGTATAAHQVEGDNRNNDWWVWEQKGEGRIFQNQTSGKACEWWAGRAEEDIARMAALNTNAHRLSIEWSRIEPRPGKWDHDALDRYRAILKAMREAGIEPMVTLHHFTNPIWMAERGGWMHPDSPQWFNAFVKKAVTDLSDLCDMWCTINEPTVYAGKGYFDGSWPPGMKNVSVYFRVVYNMLSAHAAAYHTIHDLQPVARVGLAHHMIDWYPLREGNPLDRMVTRLLDSAFNGIVLDALALGQWRPPIGRKGEFPAAKGTLDWIGLNYYQRFNARFSLKALGSLGITYGPRPGQPHGPEGKWGELYPDGLFNLIKRLYRQFNLPIYITENGVPDGSDTIRPGFLLEHLRRVWQAVNFSWSVRGYYFWSLLDNFEWAEGYDPRFRFGLYETNFETQERTLRRSGELYAEIAKANAFSSDMARRYAPQVVDKLFPGQGPQDLEAEQQGKTRTR
jgi:beta-glucosidase